MDKDVAEILEIFERVFDLDAEGTIKFLINQRHELQARNVDLVYLSRELNERLKQAEEKIILWRAAAEELLKQHNNFEAFS